MRAHFHGQGARVVKRTAREEILVCGLDDWVDVSWADQLCGRHARGEGENVGGRAVSLIGELLAAGLIRAGDLTDSGFEPWKCSAEEATERIARTWAEDWGTESPTPGGVAWFANTDEGDRVGRSVLMRERGDGHG